jgi:hypothetical protein
VWSSYLGGSGTDGWISDNHAVIMGGQTGPAIAVDGAGNVYVTGSTSSANFPTTPGAFQTHLANPPGRGPTTIDSDAYVTKINPTGTALIYSTYLGGNNLDGGAGIVVDSSGNAYVTGWSQSTNFPTLNPIQAQKASGNDLWNDPNSDVFVAALNSAGSGLLFSTYLGGSGADYGFGIALDPTGNVYVAGQTIAPNGPNTFPVTPGAYQSAASAQYNGLVFKINPVAAAGSLSVTGFPLPTTAGQAGTLTVTALNADGTVNTNYTGTVHFTSSDPKAVLPADYTFTAADQGVHTFSVTLKTAGSQSITAADTTGTVIGEVGITITPAAASQFLLSAPSSVTKGSAFSLTLTVEDAYGNVVTGYVGTVHFTSSDSSATLPANYTFTAGDAGVHTFTSTAILRKRGTQTLSVTDTQNSALTTTDTINVT